MSSLEQELQAMQARGGFCATCGEDDDAPHSLYEHVLSVLEDHTNLDTREREKLASALVSELKAPFLFAEQQVTP